MRAVFINLDRARERRRLMEAQAARLGLSFERLAAVEASSLGEGVLLERGRAWQRPLSGPEMACFLSHELLWRRIADEGEPVLVLEDDVVLSERLPALLRDAATLGDVDLLNLESFDRRRYQARRPRTVAPGLTIRRVFRDKSGSAAYVLWPNGARKLLARARRGAAPVDAFLHGAREIVSFQVEPAAAMQLHILKARGVAVPIADGTTIQTRRLRPSFSMAQVTFRLRRIRAQTRLAADRLETAARGGIYRKTDVVEAEFTEAAAALRAGLEASGPDQRSS